MNSGTSQRDTFLSSEGDGWFSRNVEALDADNVVRNDILQSVARHLPSREALRILEVGCAGGHNLASLQGLLKERGQPQCFGIDPSGQAVDEGGKRFPSLKLTQGTAESLPYDDSSMDVLWFGFCLYLVDRTLLHRAVAEADRVLSDGGLLVIHDFDPGVPTIRNYVHAQGMCSYKMDYAKLFLANPAYQLAEKRSLSHQRAQWTPDPQERIGLWLIRKNLDAGYQHL